MFKLIRKLILFLPLLIGMMFVSYRVDPSGLFWGAGFERLASEYMLQGYYIDGYERLDGRKLNEVFAKNIPEAPQILINGSSRSLMVTNKIVSEGKTFYNTANVGADIVDFFTSYYIFAKEGKEPEKMIFGIDPWIFNDKEYTLDKRSNKELYNEFLGEELGYENLKYEKPDKNEKFKALIDPSYFQASIRYYQKDKSEDAAPEIIAPEDVMNRTEVIKAPDGSIIYDKKFRTYPQEVVDRQAVIQSGAIMRVDDFPEISEKYTDQFERFIEYLQAKNIEVVFYLPPYHPHVYRTAQRNTEKYHCFLEVEDYLNSTAKKYGIEVYGSYDPEKLGLTNADFYDGIHLRRESVSKILNNL